MRKIFLSAIFLWLFFQYASGQDKGKIEVSVGSGVWSSDELFDGYSPGFLSQSFRIYTNDRFSGAFCATVKYFVKKRVSVGIAFAYENESGDWRRYDDVYGGGFGWEAIQLGTYKRQAFTVAPEVCATYFEKDIARLYFTASIGITFRNEVDKYSDAYYASQYNNGVNILGKNQELNKNGNHFNLYYSPFGISVGRSFRWFAEVGIGYKGILNTGFSYKF